MLTQNYQHQDKFLTKWMNFKEKKIPLSIQSKPKVT